jgi:hypothetical protein
MSLAIPKIVYTLVSGAVTLNFTYPPVQKAGTNDLSAQRADAISLSGRKQTWWTRTDEFFILTMEYADIASDMPLWDAFIQYALMGGTFDYYPDATLLTFSTFTLEDTDFNPKFNFRSIAKFTLKLREYVP